MRLRPLPIAGLLLTASLAAAACGSAPGSSREYGTWADWLGVPRHTFSATFRRRDCPERGSPRGVPVLPPGLRSARRAAGPARRRSRGVPEPARPLPDARACLQALRDPGYFVGVAGNQTAQAGRFLRELNLPCDVPLRGSSRRRAGPRRGACRAGREPARKAALSEPALTAAARPAPPIGRLA